MRTMETKRNEVARSGPVRAEYSTVLCTLYSVLCTLYSTVQSLVVTVVIQNRLQTTLVCLRVYSTVISACERTRLP